MILTFSYSEASECSLTSEESAQAAVSHQQNNNAKLTTSRGKKGMFDLEENNTVIIRDIFRNTYTLLFTILIIIVHTYLLILNVTISNDIEQ